MGRSALYRFYSLIVPHIKIYCWQSLAGSSYFSEHLNKTILAHFPWSSSVSHCWGNSPVCAAAKSIQHLLICSSDTFTRWSTVEWWTQKLGMMTQVSMREAWRESGIFVLLDFVTRRLPRTLSGQLEVGKGTGGGRQSTDSARWENTKESRLTISEFQHVIELNQIGWIGLITRKSTSNWVSFSKIGPSETEWRAFEKQKN